jgi:tRNA-splicing ligase RtcB
MKKVISTTKVPVKIWTNDIEEEAVNQLKNVANLPFIHKHVAVMPDAHVGKGSTVGTVIATKGAIIPSAVGVDCGCGMCAVKLPFKVDRLGDLSKLRSSIERSIPVGKDSNKELSNRVLERAKHIEYVGGCSATEAQVKKALHQIGTLGGGNHFIEICKDLDNHAWVMLHSGSRNIGKVLAEKHIENAKGLMKRYFIDLPDPDLAYLVQGTQEFNDYIKDLMWAQRFAAQNRAEMMSRVLKDISYQVYGEDRGEEFLTTFKVDCHHNYTQLENHYGQNVWVTRKGAVSAKEGQFGIIPGSMGAKSFLVTGKGNPESFNSCSHGAGRKMSRTKARELFSKEDLEKQTEGIECRKDNDVIDEIPSAYKDIDEVMNNQADLVTVHQELKQLLCVKGN